MPGTWGQLLNPLPTGELSRTGARTRLRARRGKCIPYNGDHRRACCNVSVTAVRSEQVSSPPAHKHFCTIPVFLMQSLRAREAKQPGTMVWIGLEVGPRGTQRSECHMQCRQCLEKAREGAELRVPGRRQSTDSGEEHRRLRFHVQPQGEVPIIAFNVARASRVLEIQDSFQRLR